MKELESLTGIDEKNYKYWYVLTLNPVKKDQLWTIWYGLHPLYMILDTPANQPTWWSEIPEDVALDFIKQIRTIEPESNPKNSAN